MDYSVLFRNTLVDLGFDAICVSNCFETPYDAALGWPLKLPEVEFHANTLLVLHFQDFVTFDQGQILELQKVEHKYKDRAGQVAVIHWCHNLGRFYAGAINLLEFNVHESNIITNLNSKQANWRVSTQGPRTLNWQCLNGRQCAHRLRTVQKLQTETNGVLSHGDVISLDQWPYHTYRGTENEDNFIRLLPIYGQAKINIVTETIYEDPVGLITEKTVLAFLSRQVPIVIGYKGIVSDCQVLGFDMFDDLVDISYDTICNEQRVEAAIDFNLDLIRGNIDISAWNKRLDQQQEFVLDRWNHDMIQRFRDQCKILASRLLI